jgi:hypothetical protein
VNIFKKIDNSQKKISRVCAKMFEQRKKRKKRTEIFSKIDQGQGLDLGQKSKLSHACAPLRSM